MGLNLLHGISYTIGSSTTHIMDLLQFSPGAPAELPSCNDVCDTLPYDATLAATPESKENLVSPEHDANAKREAFQRKPVNECVEPTPSVKVPTSEDKSTIPMSTDVPVSRDKDAPKKKTTAPKKINTKEEQFSNSDQEAR